MAGEVMAAEMAEQPAILRRLLDRRPDLVSRVRAVLPERLTGIVLIARGSSSHAAVFGRYALEAACGRPVALAAPSLHTLYGARIDYRGYLAVGISQSGRTPEIVTVLEHARTAGARTVAVTNEMGSPLAATAEVVLDLGAGGEHAIPATKTFTAQLVAFAVLAEALGEVPWRGDLSDRLSEAVEAVLGDPEPAEQVAGEIGAATGLLSVGRGYLYAVALEAALKLKETIGLLAEGYSAADLLHGPIAVVERGLPVLAFVACGPTRQAMARVVAELRSRGGRVFVAGDEPHANLPVAGLIPEPLVAVPTAVRAQQVAYALAMARGLDPDRRPGLTKVTPTM